MFPRKIAAGIRVGAGMNSVEPHLATSLKTRNHILDDNFSSKTLMLQQKKKKRKDTDDDEQDDDTDEENEVDEDGCQYVEKVGVSNIVILQGLGLVQAAATERWLRH